MRAPTDCGAISAKPQTKRRAIEDALCTLGSPSTGGNLNIVLEIRDAVVDFCAVHFPFDEQAFRDHGYTDADANAGAHEILLSRLRAARALMMHSTNNETKGLRKGLIS